MSSGFKLLITTDSCGDQWDYVLTLCEAVSQLIKAKILVVCFGDKPQNTEKYDFEVLYTNLKSSNIANCNTNEISIALYQVIEEFNPDIVHLNHYLGEFKTNRPTVLTSHGDDLNRIKWINICDKRYFTQNNIEKYRILVEKSLNNASIIITSSRFLAEELIKTYSFKNKIKVIYNGISYNPSSNIPEEPSIITTGNFKNKSSNIDLLVKLSTKIPGNIKLLLAGEKPQENYLPRRIQYLGNLLSWELEKYYEQSSIYLALSTYETYGTELIKAAYSNCAIVANNIPYYKELWKDCACIFEKNNINSLIRNINNLVENNLLLKQIAKNCQTKALSSFNAKRMAYEYINIYKNILQMNIVNKNNLLQPEKYLQIKQ